jgi:signal transduction histidine kinase
LINGFKQLENGHFGIQVTPQGVSEINQTIQRFNTMSIQLAKLADAESKLQEQHHLTEISDVSKGIAHALRNPMHTIGLAIEQLQSNNLSEPVKQKLFAQIQSKIVQLDKNIKALLTITSDGLERVQTLSLSGLINDVVLELKQTHDSSKGKLKIDLELDDSIKILGAESEFRSILHTLLFNAYEASFISGPDLKTDQSTAGKDPDDGLIHLIIKSYNENELAVISITDFGSGLSPDIQDRLFTAHCSTKAEGAGMGLYISKKLIELHYEGSLTVQNNTENDRVTGVTALCTIAQTSKKSAPENGNESGFKNDDKSTTENKNTGSN